MNKDRGIAVFRAQDHPESGAALIFIALSIVAVMALASVAVDAAAAWSQRRANQGAVDTAAIAGAQFTVDVDDAVARQDAQEEVIRITYVSIAPDMTEAAWEKAWLDCTDPDRPAEYTDHHTSDCVSFTEDMTQMRVRLPDVNVPTSFARVVGADSIATTAAAEVQIGAGASDPDPPAIFAAGDNCGVSHSREQIDISGSNNTIYGGIHSNDNIDVSGSDNDFGSGDPGDHPFTYANSMTEGGSGNGYDHPYPEHTGETQGLPVELYLTTYDDDSDYSDDLEYYYYVDGDIDGAYIESRGNGLYYATGNIKLDKDLDADVTLVAEGVVEVTGSTQVLDPYVDGVLIFAAKQYSGVERCDKFVVKMSGSTNTWTGLIYGIGGLVEMAGSANTSVTGSLVGNAVRVNGSNVSIETATSEAFNYGPNFFLLK